MAQKLRAGSKDLLFESKLAYNCLGVFYGCGSISEYNVVIQDQEFFCYLYGKTQTNEANK